MINSQFKIQAFSLTFTGPLSLIIILVNSTVRLCIDLSLKHKYKINHNILSSIFLNFKWAFPIPEKLHFFQSLILVFIFHVFIYINKNIESKLPGEFHGRNGDGIENNQIFCKVFRESYKVQDILGRCKLVLMMTNLVLEMVNIHFNTRSPLKWWTHTLTRGLPWNGEHSL